MDKRNFSIFIVCVKRGSKFTEFNNRFPVHRLIMMSTSEYFRALLGPNFKEGHEKDVNISNVDGPTLGAIINFCYSGNIEITDDNIMQIIEAASAMELVRIEKKCEQFWNEKLSTSNCVEIFLAAEKFSILELRKTSIDFICEHFTSIAPEIFLEIDFSTFAMILKCDNIHAIENLIIERLIKWIEYDDKNRSKYAPALLKLMRMEKVMQPVRSEIECIDTYNMITK